MNPNGTPENLIPLTQRTPEEARAIRSKGGYAAKEANAKRKSMAEEIDIALSRPGVQASIITAMIQAAKEGNTTAAAFLRDTVGEKPTEKQETTIKAAQAAEESARATVRNLYDKIG